MKALKLKRLSIYASVIVAAVSSIAYFIFLEVQNVPFSLLYTTGSFILIMVVSYMILNYSLDRYFYHNIRTIYRNILQLRTSSTQRIPRKLPDDRVINEINRILIDWEKENKDEIVHLKELEEFRKEFLGNVSHELKTPIFTIQGYVHTLLDGGIEDQEINLLYLQKAAKSIDRLISIVDDLESISKLEAGELILENRTFDINDLVNDVIESIELKARENNITVDVEDDGKAQLYVYADKDRIRQVLVNLLVNSYKYGKKNGHTNVKVEDHDEYVTVEIKDDGIGIDKAHLGRLFERFYRVDKSRSREQGGTGLGLAIVKHIIEAHGEKISVDSAPGAGTSFTFTLKKSK